MHGDLKLLSIVQSTRSEGLPSLSGSSRGSTHDGGGDEDKVAKGNHLGLAMLWFGHELLGILCKRFWALLINE